MMNAPGLDRLPEDQKAAILRAHKEAGIFSQSVMNDVAAKTICTLQGKGATYLEMDTKPAIGRAQAFYPGAGSTARAPYAWIESQATPG